MNAQPATVRFKKNLIQPIPCTLYVSPVMSEIKLLCTSYRQGDEEKMEAYYFFQ